MKKLNWGVICEAESNKAARKTAPVPTTQSKPKPTAHSVPKREAGAPYLDRTTAPVFEPLRQAQPSHPVSQPAPVFSVSARPFVPSFVPQQQPPPPQRNMWSIPGMHQPQQQAYTPVDACADMAAISLDPSQDQDIDDLPEMRIDPMFKASMEFMDERDEAADEYDRFKEEADERMAQGDEAGAMTRTWIPQYMNCGCCRGFKQACETCGGVCQNCGEEAKPEEPVVEPAAEEAK